jgi:hypothetical protein
MRSEYLREVEIWFETVFAFYQGPCLGGGGGWKPRNSVSFLLDASAKIEVDS